MKNTVIGQAARDPASQVRFWITAGLGLAVDLLSKWGVWRWLDDSQGQSCEIIRGFLAVRLWYNPGIAFGIELGRPVIIAAVAAGILLVIWLFLASERTAAWAHIGLGLILSGALGNLVDRLMFPWKVRDFIAFSFWPTFNLADAFLCIGVGILALHMLRTPSQVKPPKQ